MRNLYHVGYKLSPFKGFLFVFFGWRPKEWTFRRRTAYYEYYYDKESGRNFIVDRVSKRPMEIFIK